MRNGPILDVFSRCIIYFIEYYKSINFGGHGNDGNGKKKCVMAEKSGSEIRPCGLNLVSTI